MPFGTSAPGAALRRAASATIAVSLALTPALGFAAKKKPGKPAAPPPAPPPPAEPLASRPPAAKPAPDPKPADPAPKGPAALPPEERAKLHFRAGRALMDLGRFGEATIEFEAGHSLAPRPAFLFNLGQALWYEGKLAPALAKFEAALKFTAPAPDAALAKLIREDMERLRVESRGGAKSKRPAPPTDKIALAKIHYDLAGANFDLGRFGEAMASFRAGYKLYARPGFLLNMATCLEALGDYGEAIRHAEGYIAHAGPTDPNVSMARELMARARKSEEGRIGGPITAVLTAPAEPSPRTGRTGWWIAGGAAGLVLLAGAGILIGVLTSRPGRDWIIESYGPLSP